VWPARLALNSVNVLLVYRLYIDSASEERYIDSKNIDLISDPALIKEVFMLEAAEIVLDK
jgi:hypothetical protein